MDDPVSCLDGESAWLLYHPAEVQRDQLDPVLLTLGQVHTAHQGLHMRQTIGTE